MDGQILVGAGAVEETQLEPGQDWRVAASGPQAVARQIRELGAVFVYRPVRVRGSVTARDAGPAFDPTAFEIDVFLGGDPRSGESGISAPPRDPYWAKCLGMYPMRLGRIVRGDGTFSCVMPAATGLYVRASAPGWAYGWAPLQVHDDGPGWEPPAVELLVSRNRLIAGKILDASGRPLAGARIHLYVTVTGDLGIRKEALGLLGGGVTCVRGTGWCQICVRRYSIADEAGEFEVGSPITGDALLVVTTDGVPVLRHSLGSLDADVRNLDLAVAARLERQLIFRYENDPIADMVVRVTDVTDSVKGDRLPQVSWRLRTDAYGLADASSLREGRKYILMLFPKGRGSPRLPRIIMKTLLYDGQPEVDLADLEYDFH